MTPTEIHAQEAAKTYRVSFYRRGETDPAKVREYTGLAYGTVQLKGDEWREWTGGTAVIETVDTRETEVTADAATPDTRYAVRYGNRFADGQEMAFVMPAWEYRPMAERDAHWKLVEGWDFADIMEVSAGEAA